MSSRPELSPRARAYVDELVAAAPPLTQEQRDKLRILLAPVRVARARDLPGGAA